MENITYYLGAGASYNALPLYSTFQERLQIFHDYLYHIAKTSNNVDKQKCSFYLGELQKLIEILNINENPTVDILAQELYDSPGKKMDFYNLKYLISDFFVFEQLIKDQATYLTTSKSNNSYYVHSQDKCDKVNTRIDNRYKQFILPLLNANWQFPSNINFISWNYDLQLELSLATNKNCSIKLAQNKLQVYPSPETEKGINTSLSSVIKLNGTAGIFYKNSTKNNIDNFIEERYFALNETYLNIMFTTFYENRHRIFGGEPFFKFYFEMDHPLQNKALHYANEIMAKTEVLVIIGYTFHTSNRKIDMEVFKNANSIKKAILQVHPSNFEEVKYNLLKIKPTLEKSILSYPTLTSFPPPDNI